MNENNIYTMVNSVRDINPVIDITAHPLSASEDKKGIVIHQTNIFIVLF